MGMRVGADDSELLASHLGLENPKELHELRNYRAIARLLEDGNPSNIARFNTDEPEPPEHPNGNNVKSYSRNRRGRDASIVERPIKALLTPKILKPARKRRKEGSW